MTTSTNLKRKTENTVSTYLEEQVATSRMKYDAEQARVARHLSKLQNALTHHDRHPPKTALVPRGVYLHGSAGTGKFHHRFRLSHLILY